MLVGKVYNLGATHYAIKSSGTVTLGTEGKNSGPTVGSPSSTYVGLLQENGTVNFYYGTIQGKALGAEIKADKFTSGGAIKNLTQGNAALKINGAGVDATISGGEIGNKSSKTYAKNALTIVDDATDTGTKAASTIAISGGTIYSDGNAIENNDSDVTVTLSGVVLKNEGTWSGNVTATFKAIIDDEVRTYATDEARTAAIGNPVATVQDSNSQPVRYYTTTAKATAYTLKCCGQEKL